MKLSFSLLLEIFLLVTALSVDTFIAFLAYGSRGIKVPVPSVCVISAVCTGILSVSTLLGSLLCSYIPGGFARVVSFSILFLIGAARFFDSALKAWIRRSKDMDRKMNFTVSSLHFFLEIYADPETADLDSGGTLSPKEAAFLAVALSFDGVAAGFGAGASSTPLLPTAAMSFTVGVLAALSGIWIGRKIAERSPVDISPLSGILLIVLAFMKLF